MEEVKLVLMNIAPIVAGFITSIVIPFLIKHISVKHLIKKIDEVSPSTEIQKLTKEIAELKREIMEMRGKVK